MESGIARNGDVQIAYEDFGKPGGRPLLLISGLDDQMISVSTRPPSELLRQLRVAESRPPTASHTA